MKSIVLCTVLLLVSLSGLSLALTPGEIAALESLRDTFPGLLNVNALDEYDDEFVHYGGSWPADLTTVCSGRDGWRIHGIYCENDAVTRLRFTNSWREHTRAFTFLEGLTALKNFSVASSANQRLYYEHSCAALLDELANVISLTSVDIPFWFGLSDFPTTSFGNTVGLHNSLQDLTLFIPNGIDPNSFAPFTSLLRINLISPAHTCSLNNFGPILPTTLLELSTDCLITNPGDFVSFTQLHTAKFTAPMFTTGIDPNYPDPFQVPSSLLSLKIVRWPSSVLKIDPVSASIQTLELESITSGVTLGDFPDTVLHLKLIDCNSVSWPSIAFPTFLETFHMQGCQEMTYLPGHLSVLTYLKSIHIESVAESTYSPGNLPTLSNSLLESFTIKDELAITQADFESFICTFPSATFRELVISDTSFSNLPASCPSGDPFRNLEVLSTVNSRACTPSPTYLDPVAGVTQLKRLTFDGCHYSGVLDWGRVTSSYPKLELLSFDGLGINDEYPSYPNEPFPDFTSLANLSALHIMNVPMTSTIPPNFLSSMTKLQYLTLENLHLDGPLPSSGWANLTEVKITGNYFTNWTSIDPPGAPKMSVLWLDSNNFETIPSDADFMTMTPLREFRANSNQYMTSALPTFWANGYLKVVKFSAVNTPFQGTIPTIESPFIRELTLRNTSICGELPNITRSVFLKQIDWSTNRLTGTVPTSWGSYLSAGRIDLSNNQLFGTFPNPLLDSYSGPFTTFLSFNDNYFAESGLSVSGLNVLGYIGLNGPTMTFDPCLRDPGFSSTNPSCDLNLEATCGCTQYWDTCAGYAPSCSPTGITPMGVPPPFNPPPSFFVCHIPITAPYAIPTPSEPLMASPEPAAAPITTSPPTPTPNSASSLPCPPPAPGLNFECVDGTWTANSSITQPTLEVPDGTTYINGNVTIQGPVTFGGLDSHLVVNGCVFFLSNGEVTIELTKEEVEQLSKEGKITKTLISALNANNCPGSTNLGTIALDVKKGSGSKGCRKVKATNQNTSRSTLNVAFQIDNTNCNVAIIVPCVVGAVIIITAILAFILIRRRNAKFKAIA